jgi:hypothetical protein
VERKENSRHKKFEDKVKDLLTGAGVEFETEPAIGGIQPDFLIHSPQGNTVILETKSWLPDDSSLSRAVDQVKMYQALTGADRAFIVFEGLNKGRPKDGVLAVHELISNVYDALKEPPQGKQRVSSEAEKTIFAAMPFAKKYDDTFFLAMAPAAEAAGVVCKRIDQEEYSGIVVTEINRMISESSAVIIDLSDSNPNVLYEAGYAHALKLPAVHICSSPLDNLPFDVKPWNTMQYNLGQVNELKGKLERRLKKVLAG